MSDKIKLVIARRHPQRPLIDPPLRCEVCDNEQPAWMFGTEPRKPPLICSHCSISPRARRTLGWRELQGLSHYDWQFFGTADAVLEILKREIENGKRRRTTAVAC